jgi:hypothetical protein
MRIIASGIARQSCTQREQGKIEQRWTISAATLSPPSAKAGHRRPIGVEQAVPRCTPVLELSLSHHSR